LADVIATPMTIGTSAITAAATASTTGQRKLRRGPESGELDVEVIFSPCFTRNRCLRSPQPPGAKRCPTNGSAALLLPNPFPNP
jgi:hypothetical protein